MRRHRLALAAAHVVLRDDYADVPHSPERPGAPDELLAAIDWERTVAFRRHLDGLGYGIAEAMDTAQRFELGWPGARALIEATGAAGLANGFVAGVSYDQRPDAARAAEVVDAVVEQVELVRAAGGVPIVLPLPWLAAHAQGPAAYVDVYGAIVRQVEGPLLLHWLGPAFHAGMAGYFPGDSLARILALDREKVRGVKLSILDPAREVALRRALLPHDQLVLTGDDWAFRALVEGGDPGRAEDAPVPVERWTRVGPWEVAVGDFSHALLGVLDAVAAPMARALERLAAGDVAGWRALADPCEELGRVVFEDPTTLYKVGLAALAEAGGHQPNRMLLNHVERLRDAEHLRRVRAAAVAAGVLPPAD